MKRCLRRRVADAILVVAVLAAASLARAQTPPAEPTACGEVFRPGSTTSGWCRFFRDLTLANRALDQRAGRLCATKFGTRCATAVRIETRSRGCSGPPWARCSCSILNTYRCVGPKAPDVSASLTSSSLLVKSGTPVTVKARVCNEASTAVTASVGLYYGRVVLPACSSPTSGLLDEATITLPAGPGRCIEETLALGVLPVGGYSLAIKADNHCRLAERNETNNIGRLVIAVGRREADLYPRLAATALGGGRVRYDVTLCRSGPETREVEARLVVMRSAAGTTRPFACSMTTGVTEVLGTAEVVVPAGCTTISVEGTRPSGRTERVCFALDARCAVYESAENNNVACATYTVR